MNVESTLSIHHDLEAHCQRRARDILKSEHKIQSHLLMKAIARQILEEAISMQLLNLKIRYTEDVYPND